MTDLTDTARLLSELADTADALAQVIHQENAALDRGDRRAVAALGPDKTAAARLFATRFAGLRDATDGFRTLSADDRRFLTAALEPVARLTDENARRLAVAVEVGRRVMTAVATAVRAMAPGPGTYSASGSVGGGWTAAAAGPRSLALSVDTSL